MRLTVMSAPISTGTGTALSGRAAALRRFSSNREPSRHHNAAENGGFSREHTAREGGPASDRRRSLPGSPAFLLIDLPAAAASAKEYDGRARRKSPTCDARPEPERPL